jgi:hypothetical protein
MLSNTLKGVPAKAFEERGESGDGRSGRKGAA